MSDYSRLIEIFEKLVHFRTVTGDHAEAAKCLDYCETILVKGPLIINRYSSNGFESIMATTRETKKPKVLLQAHLDVVPAADELFTLEGVDDRLIGRGAFDMKYAAACYLYLVEELGDRCTDFDFGIMFTNDEEIGGLNGSDYLLGQGISCKVCILPDGGDNWRLETAAKGIWHITCTAEGTSAHGSRPWEGDNAAVKLLGFLTTANRLVTNKSRTGTTLSINMMQAGKTWNQVPDTASAVLDIRYLNQSDYGSVNNKIVTLAKKFDIKLDYEQRAKSIQLDISLPLIREWERVVSEVRGANAANGYALSFGSSDARYFHDRSMPTIVTRPEGGGIHAGDEWINEAGLYQFYDCLRNYLDAVCGKRLRKVAITA